MDIKQDELIRSERAALLLLDQLTPLKRLKKLEAVMSGCDCCGKSVPRDQIARVVVSGLDTDACQECRS